MDLPLTSGGNHPPAPLPGRRAVKGDALAPVTSPLHRQDDDAGNGEFLRRDVRRDAFRRAAMHRAVSLDTHKVSPEARPPAGSNGVTLPSQTQAVKKPIEGFIAIWFP